MEQLVDKELLELLQGIRDEIRASEERMTGKIVESEERMTGKIVESEERMTGKMTGLIAESEERMTGKMTGLIAESEERMTGRIVESEERTTAHILGLKAYIESDVMKKIDLIAEGHKMLSEKIDRLDAKTLKIDDIEGALAAQDALLAQGEKRILKLEKKQG